MLNLLIAVMFSASIVLILKYSENELMNRHWVTSANYFTAFTISIFMILNKKLLINYECNYSFIEEFKMLPYGHIFSPSSSIMWGLIVGGIFGISFYFSFIYYQKSVSNHGAALSGTISKLGVLLPLMFSLVIWREYPSAAQWAGILLALGSIIIVNLSDEINVSFDMKPLLILLFIFTGLAEFSNKLFQKYALSEYKDIFLFSVFFSAFIISFYKAVKERKNFTLKSIITGIMIGIPNLFSSYFLILALDTVNTSVAFPIYSAGSIMLINIGSLLIFDEKINRKSKISIILTIFALILINI